MELLLATVRPWQLMTGKVLGIGLVGLIQILLIAVAGVIAGLATDVLTISTSAAVGTVVWLIVWYLLGFFMYAWCSPAWARWCRGRRTRRCHRPGADVLIIG